MISLSNLIKAEFTKSDQDKIIIHNRTLTLIKTMDEREKQPADLSTYNQEAEKIIEDAKRMAEELLNNAKQEYENQLAAIDELRQNWENEKLQLMEEAKDLGYKAGFEAGKQQGHDEYQEQLVFAKELIEKARIEASEYIEASERTILQLAIQVAEQIIVSKLDENEEAFLNIVKKVLQEAKEHYHLYLYIHPSKYDLIIIHKDELVRMMNREKNLLIYPDDQLAENACILESSFGRIDASIDSQLAVLKEKLLNLLEEE